MIRKEIYRILSRKIILLAMVVAIAFSVYYGYFSIWDEAVIDHTQIYRHGRAVAYDRQISEEFAGILTEETVRAIWERYGAPVNYFERSNRAEVMLERTQKGGCDNFLNYFVARKFAMEEELEDGTAILVLPEDLSTGKRYLDGNYVFGYVGQGWNWYWDRFLIILLLVSLVVIIGFSPVFSEDYAFRTADIILPTVKGRFRIWCVRTGSGFLFASVCYWIMCGIAFLQNSLIYGLNGLSVSCGFTDVPYFLQEDSDPLWKALLIMHLGGWFSMLVLVVQIQAISSRCRSGFGALLWSLIAYLGPIAVIRTILDNLPFYTVIKWLKYIGYSMPFSFAGMYMQAPPSGKQIVFTFALISTVLAGVLGSLGWSRHQVRN